MTDNTDSEVILWFSNLEGEGRCVPHINENYSFEYSCDGKEGSIEFDGYFNVEDEAPPYPEDYELTNSNWLPKKLIMLFERLENKPYLVEGGTSHHKTIEKYTYLIEVYKRVKHESTNKYDNVTDDDGEKMSICYFPSDRQTIYFRVLEKL